MLKKKKKTNDIDPEWSDENGLSVSDNKKKSVRFESEENVKP